MIKSKKYHIMSLLKQRRKVVIKIKLSKVLKKWSFREQKEAEQKRNLEVLDNRKINLDILKIIACFLVIVNHTNSRIFLESQPSIIWFVSLVYFFISKIAVPIFVMISGATLIGKEEKYRTVIVKRILKILAVMLVFSFIYYYIYYRKWICEITGKNFIYSFFYIIIEREMTMTYWYLYMYLGLLVMLPIIRKMCKNLDSKDYLYILIVWGLFIGTVPIIVHYCNMPQINNYFELPIFTGYVVYFMIGYWIDNKLEDKYFNKKIAIILGSLSIASIVASVGLTYYEYNNTGANNYLFMDNVKYITIAIPSITVFYLAKYMVKTKKVKKESMEIRKIATCTFGIYLLSDLLIYELEFVYQFLVKYMNEILAIAMLQLSVFTVGMIITCILKKIPGFRKII